MLANRFVWLPTIACVGLLTVRPAAAQRTLPLTEPAAFTLDQWTTEHGLPQNSVTAIAQTPDGYLVVGTFGGLARFDGVRFRRMERVDSAGRHVDRVLSLAVGRDSALWIGTENGLLRYYKNRYDRYTTADGLPNNQIPVLHVDRTGALWIGTERGGVTRFAGGQFQRFPEIDGVPLDHVVSIKEDASGTVWVKAGDRFVIIGEGHPGAMRWRAAPAPALIRLELQDRAGAYWFRQRSGLVRVVDGAVRRYGRGDGVPGPSVMVEDPGGGYWLGTHLDGLFFFPQPATGSACYESSILSPTPFMGNNGEVFRLADGSLWEVKYEYEYLYEYYPDVIVCPARGRLVVGEKTLNVQQIAAGRAPASPSVPQSGTTQGVIESRIDGEFSGWEGETIFKLQNGQVWQQSSYAYKYKYAYSPEVLIYRSGSVYKMMVKGVDGEIVVRRLR